MSENLKRPGPSPEYLHLTACVLELQPVESLEFVERVHCSLAYVSHVYRHTHTCSKVPRALQPRGE